LHAPIPRSPTSPTSPLEARRQSSMRSTWRRIFTPLNPAVNIDVSVDVGVPREPTNTFSGTFAHRSAYFAIGELSKPLCNHGTIPLNNPTVYAVDDEICGSADTRYE